MRRRFAVILALACCLGSGMAAQQRSRSVRVGFGQIYVSDGDKDGNFVRLEHAARCAVLNMGGCLSHHHGVGKQRAALLPSTQAPAFSAAVRSLKTALDPQNVLGARNGMWSCDDAGWRRPEQSDFVTD